MTWAWRCLPATVSVCRPLAGPAPWQIHLPEPGHRAGPADQRSAHDLVRDGIDVGIRFGRGQYPGLTVERPMGDAYYPVASLGYNRGRLPTSPQQLKPAQLLRSDEPCLPWFQAAGLRLAEPSGGVRFQDLSLLIRSAMEGDGIALVRHVVVTQEIASGELLRLFDGSVKSPWDYYLAYPPETLHKPQVRAFRHWLLGEVVLFKAQAVAFLV